MAQPAREPIHVTVPIQIKDNDDAHGRRGTFTSPPAKLELRVNDLVKWQATAGLSFELTFRSYGSSGPQSPFAQNPITDSQEYEAVNMGLFHYTVVVKDASGNTVGEIKHCPEANVGP
jgi:hypothetical protein